MNIFDIDSELDQIAAAFDTLESDQPDEAELLQTIENYFGDLLDQRDRKLDNYARFISEKQAVADARKAEANRILALAQVDQNTADRCKALLKMWMDAKGITKVETPLHKFGIQANGGKTPLVIDPAWNPEDAPIRYRKITYSFDTATIRQDLETGTFALPFASFGEKGSHLRIR